MTVKGSDIWSVLALAGQTNSATTLDLFLPTSETGHPTVERRDGPSWLRDDDDDDDVDIPPLTGKPEQ